MTFGQKSQNQTSDWSRKNIMPGRKVKGSLKTHFVTGLQYIWFDFHSATYSKSFGNAQLMTDDNNIALGQE